MSGVFDNKVVPQKQINKGDLVYQIALLSDSANETDYLQKAVDKSNELNANYIIHLGDLSQFGGEAELKKSKEVLQSAAAVYLVLAGDHDVVEEGINFKNVFGGKVCSTQLLQQFKILCLNNPYNHTLLGQDYLNGFSNNLSSAKIVVASQPIYNPDSIRYMGYYNNDVKKEADFLLDQIRDSKVTAVLSGDTHFFSKFKDSESANLNHYTVGALSNTRNLETPNFSLLKVYSSGYVEVVQVLVD